MLERRPRAGRALDELRGYPGVTAARRARRPGADLLFVPMVLRDRDGDELTFFSTLATFGTALDVYAWPSWPSRPSSPPMP